MASRSSISKIIYRKSIYDKQFPILLVPSCSHCYNKNGNNISYAIFIYRRGNLHEKNQKRISGISGVHRPAVLTACFQPSVSASSQTTASSSTPAAQLPQQNQTAENTEQALLDKYQNVLSDFDAKQNGYFTLEINQLIYNFVATGGVSDAFLADFLTPEEAADLYPSVTAAQSEIASKIIYMRLYETFAAQVQAQAAQSASQQTVPSVPAASANGTPAGSSADTQTGSGQDDLLYRLVFQTQTRLTDLGFYTGEIDGVFDAETQQALIQFQTACGLTPDGVINQQVITVLGITV